MPDKHPSFRSVLNYPRGLFAIYQQKINQHLRLLYEIRKILPAELAERTLYCVPKETKLLLFSESALWSSQLRFYRTEVLNRVHECGYVKIESVQIKLTTRPGSDAKANASRTRLPNRDNIELIRDQAKRQADRDLQRSLSKLGDTLAKLSEKTR